MSTSVPTTLDISTTSAVPFARLVKVELRKSYDTRAGRWLLGVTSTLAAAFMVLALIVVLAQDGKIKLNDFVGIANFISGFLLPVLGIMLVTSEWTQRTAMVTFTLEAKRGRVVAAKLAAGILLAVIVSLIATVAAFEAAVRGEGSPTATGEDGERSLAVALAALESAATGRRVPVG